MFIIINIYSKSLLKPFAKQRGFSLVKSLGGLNGIPGAQSSRTLCFSSYLPEKYVDQRKNIKREKKFQVRNNLYTSFLNKIFQALSTNVLKYSIHSFSIQLLLCLISKLNIFKQSFLLVFSLRCSQDTYCLVHSFMLKEM